MAKLTFKAALSLVASEISKPSFEKTTLFVACESYVARVESWCSLQSDDSKYIFVHVISGSYELPFVDCDVKCGEDTKWYLDTTDVYFTSEAEAYAHAAKCIFTCVRDAEYAASGDENLLSSDD